MADEKQLRTTDDALQHREDVQVVSKRRKITIDGIKAKKNAGIANGTEYELTDKHMELIAECVLQTIYNLGIASDADIDFTVSIEGGTSYHTVAKDGDVMVYPREGEFYRRRIRNDRNIFKRKSEFEGNIEIPGL